jgi:MFS family permease
VPGQTAAPSTAHTETGAAPTATFAALAVPNFRRYVSGGPLLMMALIGAFTFEFEVSLPLLAEKTFHGGDTSYSWLIGALGAGAVVGGLYAARSARTGVARLTRAAVGYAIVVALVAAAPTFPAAVAACGLAGVATVIFLTTGNSTIQLASEPGYRGRVTALWSMALVGTTPIGSPIIGALSDVAGPRYALGLGAAACLAAVIVGRWPADGRHRLFGGPVTSIRHIHHNQ